MEITLEYLEAKRREYEAAYMEHLALAHANNGAMQAMQELIAAMQQPDTEPPQPNDDKKHS